MTFSETKKLLEQLKRAKYYAQKQQEELSELITSYQLLTCNFGRIGSSKNISDPVARTVEKIEKAQIEYAKAWSEVFEQIEYVKALLYELPPDERVIIEDFYLRGKSYNYISRKINYSKTSVYRKIDDGIKKLTTILQDGKNGKDYGL